MRLTRLAMPKEPFTPSNYAPAQTRLPHNKTLRLVPWEAQGLSVLIPPLRGN